jgi:ribosomal protein S6--L-glutamate ligase
VRKAKRYVALGSRLLGVPEVVTLGVKPNFFDYTEEEREWIVGSNIVLYPSNNYAEFLVTMDRAIFPSLETCLYSDEKIKQTTLFNMIGIPHPRTRVYYHLHHGDILKEWDFPFIGKLPRASAQGRGVFRIENKDQLARYLSLSDVAYVQEYIPHERDLRVVLINYQVLLPYWRERKADTFKTNVFQGGMIHFDDIPAEAVDLAKEAARECRFNDVGLDLIRHHKKWYVIEANMKYGRKALIMKGLNLKEILRQKLLSNELLSPAPCPPAGRRSLPEIRPYRISDCPRLSRG